MEVGSLPDILEGEGQAGSDTGEGHLVLRVAGRDGAHLDDAAADGIEGFLRFEQRAGFEQLQLQAPVGAPLDFILESDKAVLVGAAGARPMRLHAPFGDVLCGSHLRSHGRDRHR